MAGDGRCSRVTWNTSAQRQCALSSPTAAQRHAPGRLSNADSTRRFGSPCTRRLSSWRRWRMPATCVSQSPARRGTHTSQAVQCATRGEERGPGRLYNARSCCCCCWLAQPPSVALAAGGGGAGGGGCCRPAAWVGCCLRPPRPGCAAGLRPPARPCERQAPAVGTLPFRIAAAHSASLMLLQPELNKRDCFFFCVLSCRTRIDPIRHPLHII